ncbi:hypothetical protein ACFV19_22705 [Streptomyces griseoluteus]|uniref:hypothetical protein n=1 Tax=Streptomyces griseoluteus TaxID=29306 RepID=UPI0036A64FB6
MSTPTLPPMPVKERKTRRSIAAAFPDFALFVLGVAGLVLSGWSLGTLLHDQAGAPWPVAVFGVAVFDVVAMAACFLVYQRRADPWAAAGARLVMTGALLASAAVNGAHGYALGGWTTAAVLAAAPLAFEVVFELRHRTLTVLVWVLFRREAFDRLKVDAWQRIAVPIDGPRFATLSGPLPEVAEAIRAERSPELLSAQERTGSGPVRTADPERIRTSADSGSGGSVKDRVRALYESGTTEPDDVVRALPDAKPETVRRMVRLVRTEGGYA